MFCVDVKFKVRDRQVSLQEFAEILFIHAVRIAQKEIQSRPAPPPPAPAMPSPPPNKSTMEPRVVSLVEAARLIGIKPATVRKYVANGRIPSLRIRRRVLVSVKTIDALTTKGDNRFE